MECRDVRDFADSFLAEELLTETSHEILRHLETCRACRDDLATRRALREHVRRAIHGSRDLAARPEFLAGLRTKLERSAGHVPARRGIRFQGRWALAATLLLACALGAAYRGREWITAAGTLARAAVGDHRNCALQFRLLEQPIDLADAARRFGIAYGVLEKLPTDEVVTKVGPARVLERHACVYDGRRFAHIVFEFRGERVSLLVTSADGGARDRMQGDAPPSVTPAGRVDGTSLVSFRTARHLVFFAGDVAPFELAALADAVAAPLSRGLAGA